MSSAISSRLIHPLGKAQDASMSAKLYAYAGSGKRPAIERACRSRPNRAARRSVRWRLVE